MQATTWHKLKTKVGEFIEVTITPRSKTSLICLEVSVFGEFDVNDMSFALLRTVGTDTAFGTSPSAVGSTYLVNERFTTNQNNSTKWTNAGMAMLRTRTDAQADSNISNSAGNEPRLVTYSYCDTGYLPAGVDANNGSLGDSITYSVIARGWNQFDYQINRSLNGGSTNNGFDMHYGMSFIKATEIIQ